MEQQMSFEEALNQLEQIVDAMENGEITLEKAIEYYKKGLKLSDFCSKKLDEAEKEIQILRE